MDRFEAIRLFTRIVELGSFSRAAEQLATLPLVTCASHAYLERHGRPHGLAQLQGHHAVDNLSATTGKAFAFAFEFVRAGEVERLNLPASVAVNDGGGYVAACCAGLGLIQVPLFHVARQLASGELEEVLATHRPPAMPLHLLYAPNRQPTARLRAFIDWAGELFARAPEPLAG